MNLLLRKLLFPGCILVWIICCAGNKQLHAQENIDTEKIFRQYEVYLANGDTTNAETELKRALFWLPDSAGDKALFSLGLFNKNKGNYAEAAKTFKIIIDDFTASEYLCQAMYEYQLTSLLLKDYISEVFTYKNLQHKKNCPDSVLFNSEFISMMTDLKLYNWNAAKESCKYIFSDSTYNWDSLYTSNIPSKLKSEKKAKNLSIIPGAGQMYAGYPGTGAHSLAGQAGIAAGTTLAIINNYYALGGLVLFPLLIRLNLGGAALAVKQVQHHNDTLNSKAYENLSTIILQKYLQEEKGK